MSRITTPADDWTAVAAAWDAQTEYVDEHSAAATDALVAALALQPGDRILELAAGPGSLGATWAERVGARGTVLLSDVAPGMVDAARGRTAGLANVAVAVVDVSSIDQPAGAFDAVACRMGLMFTPEPAKAFAEIHRVLAAGGRLGAMTWGGIEHNPWMSCVGMTAMMHGLVTGGPPVGPGGIFSLGDPSVLEALAKDAGFVDVAVDEIAVQFDATSIDQHVERVCSLAGPLAAAFEAATPEQLVAVRATAAQLAADHTASDGSVALPGRALLLRARAG